MAATTSQKRKAIEALRGFVSRAARGTHIVAHEHVSAYLDAEPKTYGAGRLALLQKQFPEVRLEMFRHNDVWRGSARYLKVTVGGAVIADKPVRTTTGISRKAAILGPNGRQAAAQIQASQTAHLMNGPAVNYLNVGPNLRRSRLEYLEAYLGQPVQFGIVNDIPHVTIPAMTNVTATFDPTSGASNWKHEGCANDKEYNDYVASIQGRYARLTVNGTKPVFNTSARSKMFAHYLAGFPAAERAYHNCRACQHFIDTFGTLVVVDDHGKTRSVMWDPEDAPQAYESSIGNLVELVEGAKITGVAISDEKYWGKHKDGIWSHYHVTNLSQHARKDLSPNQVEAEKLQDFGMVTQAIGEFDLAALDKAVNLLSADVLYRSDKVLGPVKWLHDLKTKATKRYSDSRTLSNLLWVAVATAPAGFAHVRSGMASTLLQDLQNEELTLTDVKARFAAKMKPDQYQRPQAPPKSGNIESATKLVQKLGIERSLERRFATIADLKAMWMPQSKAVSTVVSSGPFAHLASAAPIASGPIFEKTLTWVKFARDVLPDAAHISLVTPPARGSYCSFVTARHADAPGILQWDNNVSWYLYMKGSSRESWLVPAKNAVVTAIVNHPANWNGPSFHKDYVVLLLEGARDTDYESGTMLFPEIVRSDLHGARAVIEAHSKTGHLLPYSDTGSGLMFTTGTLRVTNTAGLTALYTIDRYE